MPVVSALWDRGLQIYRFTVTLPVKMKTRLLEDGVDFEKEDEIFEVDERWGCVAVVAYY